MSGSDSRGGWESRDIYVGVDNRWRAEVLLHTDIGVCVEICFCGLCTWCSHGEAVAKWVYGWLVGGRNPVMDYLPGFNGECTVEKVFGVEHIREPSVESGWKIDKQV